MTPNTTGTPDGTANGGVRLTGDRKWPRPARLLVTMALLPVWAGAILAAGGSLNFIGSWFAWLMNVLMIVVVIAVWAATARSQR
jgi:hypothetical protein